jgi:hypothetical protein
MFKCSHSSLCPPGVCVMQNSESVTSISAKWYNRLTGNI